MSTGKPPWMKVFEMNITEKGFVDDLRIKRIIDAARYSWNQTRQRDARRVFIFGSGLAAPRSIFEKKEFKRAK